MFSLEVQCVALLHLALQACKNEIIGMKTHLFLLKGKKIKYEVLEMYNYQKECCFQGYLRFSSSFKRGNKLS